MKLMCERAVQTKMCLKFRHRHDSVCVCILVPFILATVPPVQGETCTTYCCASRVLHFSVYFSVQLVPTGVIGGGKHWGFFFFIFDLMPHLPPAVRAEYFLSRERSSYPFLSLVNNQVEFRLLTNIFTLWKCRKLPT
ncbi:unnamed protein product [Ectocarpus sp. 4 AP-2014]